MGSLDQETKSETTSAINLKPRSRKHTFDCPANRTLTVPDPEKPVISIVFELGETKTEIPRAQVHRNRCQAVGYYQTILTTGGLKDDFPRAKMESSWKLLQELKPAFNSAESWAGWDK
ncbi:unnamed protein product [Rhizoctonia solani]|uniref:Uncharacterized protein n=1 Tax=Rhizoctonia solani TaxID=456999 RepID=A0A8H3C2S1_9AGAM|nr:unnamed protein product [Rhizoctonia solani]